MNTNKKINSIRIRRAKRTRLGKVLCRLAGEETGAVMMEYVIVAVMIAAAVALGCYYFGGTLLDLFGVATKSADGRHDEASSELRDDVRGNDDGRIQSAQENQNKFSDKDRSGN